MLSPSEMWHGLAEILDASAEDEEVRIVVLTGAGTQAFVSGADISQFEQRRANSDAQRAYDEQTSTGATNSSTSQSRRSP